MSFDKSAKNYLNSSDHTKGTDLDHFDALFADKRFKRALDVACAAGHFAKHFPAEIKIVTDLSHNMLKTAAEAFSMKNSAVARAEFLPFRSESFDFIGCRIAMHHFKNPCMFFGEAYRLLEKGGCFVLIDSITDTYDEFLNRIERLRDPSHIKTHCPDAITGMAEAEGFHVDEIAFFPKRHDFKEWVARQNQPEYLLKEVEQAFMALPDEYRDKYRLEFENERVVAYTDKKAMFIFRK